MTTDSEWKGKYLDTLDELDKKEKSWGDIEEMLRHAISRISLVADNRDEDLNYLLTKLRKSIRDGEKSPGLRPLLMTVYKQVESLEDVLKKEASQPGTFDLFNSALQALSLPKSSHGKVKKFTKKYTNADSHQYSALVAEFVSILAEALAANPAESATKEGKPGLLERLFTRSSSDDDTEAPTIEKEALQPDQEEILTTAKRIFIELINQLLQGAPNAETLSKKIVSSSHEKELLQLVNELGVELRRQGKTDLAEEISALPPQEVLIRLLEHLDIPSELHDQLEAIKKTLIKGIEGDNIESVLRNVADLILAMREKVQQEKIELEGFLKQLTEHLQELDIKMQDNFSSHRDSIVEGRALSEQVDAEVEVISLTVQDATDIHAIKEEVGLRIDTIRQHMDRFRQQEGDRLQKAESRVAELTAQMQKMQEDSQGLQQQIVDERKLSHIDSLTGIPNRLAYNERLETESERWKRYKSPLVMAVWDIDKFKLVNDTYGHLAGDKVLTVIAKLLCKQIRKTDFVARFGGEEFVLLMPETKLEQALKVAENLRESIAKTEFHFKEQRVPITISCGLAQFTDNDDGKKAFARADAALYQAKSDGRNRCICSTS